MQAIPKNVHFARTLHDGRRNVSLVTKSIDWLSLVTPKVQEVKILTAEEAHLRILGELEFIFTYCNLSFNE